MNPVTLILTGTKG